VCFPARPDSHLTSVILNEVKDLLFVGSPHLPQLPNVGWFPCPPQALLRKPTGWPTFAQPQAELMWGQHALDYFAGTFVVNRNVVPESVTFAEPRVCSALN
jgi:hypothetical protein